MYVIPITIIQYLVINNISCLAICLNSCQLLSCPFLLLFKQRQEIFISLSLYGSMSSRNIFYSFLYKLTQAEVLNLYIKCVELLHNKPLIFQNVAMQIAPLKNPLHKNPFKKPIPYGISGTTQSNQQFDWLHLHLWFSGPLTKPHYICGLDGLDTIHKGKIPLNKSPSGQWSDPHDFHGNRIEMICYFSLVNILPGIWQKSPIQIQIRPDPTEFQVKMKSDQCCQSHRKNYFL